MNETEAKAAAANFIKAIGTLHAMNAKKSQEPPRGANVKLGSLDGRKGVGK